MDPDELAPNANIWADIWLYIRYHLITKTLMVLTVIPSFTWVVDKVIGSMGRQVISQDDYLSLLLSPQGILLIALGLVLVVAAIATDISAFIIMEGTRILRGQLPGVRQTLFAAVRTIKQYAHPSTLILVAYLVLIVPLSGVGITIGPLRDFALPVEYQEAIAANPLNLWASYAVLGGLIISGLFLMFTFHFVVLTDQTPWQGMKHSIRFVWFNKKELAWTTIKRTGIFALQVGAVGAMVLLIYTLLSGMDMSAQVRRFVLLSSVLLALQANGFILFILLPMQVRNSTRLFITFHTPKATSQEVDPPLVKEYLPNPNRPPRLAPQIVIGSILVVDVIANGIGAYRTALQFDEVFQPRERVTVYGTPDSDGLTQLDSIASIQEAAASRFSWLVVDTVSNAPVGLTMKSGEPLSQALETAKDAVNLLVRLPDDAQLSDVTPIYEHLIQQQMENQVLVAISHHPLLVDSEGRYPQIPTAFISELSVGDLTKSPADAIIVEEFERKQERVQQAREAGKTIIIRSARSVKELGIEGHHNIDGIITRHPKALRAALREREGKSDWDLILESISISR